MARHEVPDDGGNPQIPPSLLAKLQAQQGQSATPVYRVNRDGTGELVDSEQAHAPSPPERDLTGDMMPLLMGVQQMTERLLDAVDAVPDVKVDGQVNAEKFDLSTRLAIIHAGNALDYALRRVEDIGRERRIMKLRSELASEMKAAGLQGDPNTGMTPS